MTLQIFEAQLESLCQESRQSSLLAMEWFFTIVALIVVGLRLYCRSKFGKGLGWDDYTIVAGLVGFMPFSNGVFKYLH